MCDCTDDVECRDGGGMAIRSLAVAISVSVLPRLPDGGTGVDSVLHATDRAVSTAETAVSVRSAAAVRAARVDVTDVECRDGGRMATVTRGADACERVTAAARWRDGCRKRATRC